MTLNPVSAVMTSCILFVFACSGNNGSNTLDSSAEGDSSADAGADSDSNTTTGTDTGSAEEWKAFLEPSDLIWENNITTEFYEGAFVGDGLNGAMVMADSQEETALRWLMGRYDVVAHKKIGDVDMVNPRLFAGSLILQPAGTPSHRSMRMSIWDGEVNGQVTTDIGSLTFRSFVQREQGVFVIEMKTTGGESEARLSAREEWGISPGFYHKKIDPASYTADLPPLPTTSTSGEYQVITQPLADRGAHAVAWTVRHPQPDVQVLYAAIGVSHHPDRPRSEDEGNARLQAVASLDKAVKTPFNELSDKHREWWHRYMSRSRLSLPDDSFWHGFWWQQIYKFASASREDSAMLIDNSGTWPWNSSWGGIWWNLNVQLSYTPMYISNRLDAGRSLLNGLDRIFRAGQFNKNAGSLSADSIFVGRSTDYSGDSNWGELGNLTWTLFDAWRFYRYSMDDSVAAWLFPILKQDVNYYLHKLTIGSSGKLELANTMSPEFENVTGLWTYENANYAHASLRWALKALMDINDRYDLADPLRDEWEQTLDDLIPLPAGSNGLMIASGQEYTASHRHYSHLLALYPYHLVDPEQDASARDLYQCSVDHWTSLPNAFAGYSFTGACAMYATLGDGDTAIEWLDHLKTKLKPNTMYAEGGAPVVETPLSAVDSINYLLLQSWGDTVRVFPAVPSRWQNVSFERLLAEGAFEVSAERTDGETVLVRVKSLAGEPLRLNPGFRQDLDDLHFEPPGISVVSMGAGVYSIELDKGQEITITPR